MNVTVAVVAAVFVCTDVVIDGVADVVVDGVAVVVAAVAVVVGVDGVADVVVGCGGVAVGVDMFLLWRSMLLPFLLSFLSLLSLLLSPES